MIQNPKFKENVVIIFNKGGQATMTSFDLAQGSFQMAQSNFELKNPN